MSGGKLNVAWLGGGFDNPKEIELVHAILEKTKSGKIVWEKTPSSLLASVPGMQLSFVRSSSPYDNALTQILGMHPRWDVFSLRTEQGTEIMKVDQPIPNILLGAPPPDAPPPRSKLLQAIDELYSTASSSVQGDVDRAINVIKNL